MSEEKQRILVTCAKEVPPYLRAELEQLGYPILAEQTAGVATEGTFFDTMRLNLHLRTAHRVLYHLRSFEATDPERMYTEVSQIPWENIVGEPGYLCVNSAVSTPTIRDTRFAGLRCKDAVVDRIRKRTGRRPDSGPEQTGTVIFLYWKDNQCSVYVDTSGEPLSRRGYRKNPWKAPMQETLAAAVIKASGWAPPQSFVNPMCGSGTLAIEAALMAQNRAPGLHRKNFGFMHCRQYRPERWEALCREARQQIRPGTRGSKIIATDHDPNAVKAARLNAKMAGVEECIEFEVCDFAATPLPKNGGIVMINPEYGRRLGDNERLDPVYHSIGDFFKQKCLGYKGCVFTGNMELAKRVGLRTKRKIAFFNSEIECRLLVFELYQGSVRKCKQPGAENGDQ